MIEERFRALGPMPAANRRQAELIPSAEAVPNPIGSAPGWWVEREGSVTALMPGVPSEMRLMWTDATAPAPGAALRPSAAGDAHGEGVRNRRVGTRRAARDAARGATGRRRCRDLRAGRRRPRALLDGRRSGRTGRAGQRDARRARRVRLRDRRRGPGLGRPRSPRCAGRDDACELGGGHRGRAAGDPLRRAASRGLQPASSAASSMRAGPPGRRSAMRSFSCRCCPRTRMAAAGSGSPSPARSRSR